MLRGQTKLDSIIEASINIIIGYTLAVLANYVVLNSLNYNVDIVGASIIGLTMTIISFVRQYILRRYFNYRMLRKNDS